LDIGLIAEISSAQLSELTAKLYRHPFAVTMASSLKYDTSSAHAVIPAKAGIQASRK